jgi:hypothetical protein
MWIAVFRVGTWTDSAGRTKTWTEEDIDRIVSTYDPSKSEAPVVIGHPKDNAPAYGWVEALKRDGEILWAKIKDIAPEFKEWLEKKLYKKRSISLYPDGSLRHIGFLGAAPPAVKGLPDAAFRGTEGVVELSLDFAAGAVKLNKTGYDAAMRLIRDGQVDVESSWSMTADDENALLGDPPDWGAYAKWFLAEDTSQGEDTKARWKYPYGKRGKVYRSALTAIRQRAGQQGIETLFDAAGRLLEAIEKEKNMSEELEKMKAEKEKVEAEKKRVEEELQKFKEAADKERIELAAKLKRIEVESYCEKLERENKLPPAFRERGLIEFLMALEGQTAEIAFAEGKQTASAWFRKFLEALPQVVPLGAQFTSGKPDSGDRERELGLKIAGVKPQK